MHTFTIHNPWALGDTVCLSALARDIHAAHPGQYAVKFSGHYRNVFWINNPHAQKTEEPQGQLVRLEYQSGIREAGRGSKIHFLSWFHRAFSTLTGIDVPCTEPKGVIVLDKDEQKVKAEGRYWVVVAGGKLDMTAKIWSALYWQETVDRLKTYGVRCVQAGGDFDRHLHPKLDNVEQWVGRTKSERHFFSLIAGAEGVICGVTAAMHIAAVFDKPCVVINGGREEPWWEGYTNCYAPTAFGAKCKPVKVEHTFLHTMGLLDCNGNLNKGCWKDRAVPMEPADYTVPKSKQRLCLQPATVGNQGLPLCMKMITPDHVVEAVMNYYEKGVLPPIGKPKGTYPLPLAPQPAVDVSQVYKDVKAVEALLPKIAENLGVGMPRNSYLAEMQQAIDDEVAERKKTHLFHDLGAAPVLGATWNPEWDAKVPKTPKPQETHATDEFVPLDHPYIGGKLTLFVLCYGDHLDLAERCIESIVNTLPKERFDLRVALNQPSPELATYVGSLHNAGIVTKVYPDHGDRKKYPAMRQMFWDEACPIRTPYVCWFDDDSWCRQANWAALLAKTITANHQHGGRLYGAWHYHDLMTVKRQNPLAQGEKWFRNALWWRGKNLYTGSGKRIASNGSQIVFASGGFWALATHVIREANIPDERLVHNGGDITIGAQVTQAGYKVVDFSPKPKKEIIAWSDAPPRGSSHKTGVKEFPWSV
jgi:hypothetical protein